MLIRGYTVMALRMKSHNILSIHRLPLIPLSSRPTSHVNQLAVITALRPIHLSRKTEEVVTNPENAVWDPVREFHFRKFSLFDSIGLDFECRETDDYMARVVMFFGFSIAFVGICFWSYYKPSYYRFIHDWGRREAFRLVEEREAAGLPVIDVNYAPLSSIKPFLPPSDKHYTCDVETDFTYYDRPVMSVPAPKPTPVNPQRPEILGAFAPEIRVLNDGTPYKPAQQ